MTLVKLVPVLSLVATIACTPRASQPHAESRFVDPKLCSGCHAAEWRSYRQTGMGRSFYRATATTMEHFEQTAPLYHKASNRYYRMVRRDGRFFQRRHQVDASAKEINVVEASVDYIMGSGNHARTYIHRTDQNRLIELPVTWYPENSGLFAMSPGYDRPDHFDFRRKIGYDCFFCHNAYPSISPGRDTAEADPVYPTQLPEGIDCQRCHGPGSVHIDVAQRQRPAAEIRQAITNPARLTTERQLELCMSCHLETTSFVLPASIQRYERGTFSFRPGEPLGDFMLHFDHAKGTGHDDKFEIVSAAYRLRQSACFIKSSGALVCTTCHNPHQAPRGEQAVAQYTAACRKCHEQGLQKLIAARRHTDQSNCIPCHMAQRRTEDVIHAAMTDHLILRKQAARDPLMKLAERHDAEGSYRGNVALYYPPTLPASAERDLYLAVAQVAQRSNLETGIPELESALRTHRPARPEFYMAMAQAQLATGHPDKAVAEYRNALERAPKSLSALRGLGVALAKMGDSHGAVTALEQARAIEPGDAATLHELGLAYRELGRGKDAVAVLKEAIQHDPDLPEIRNSLGNLLLEVGERDQAEEAIKEAIRSQPDFAAAHADLGNALASRGDLAGAEREYHTAIQFDPGNAAARYGYGAALASHGQFGEAEKHIEEAVKLAPDFADAQAILGDLYARRSDWARAVTHYHEALRTKPDLGRAHLGLGTALAATRDPGGAREHLSRAAQDPNPEIAQEAQQLLRRLPQ